MIPFKSRLSPLSYLALFVFVGMLVSMKPGDHGYKIGDEAMDFELKNVDGSKVSMGMMRYSNAKGFIIVFTCNHCPFAKRYEDRIIALSKKYEPLGFPLIAINPNDPELEPEDSFENMQKRAKEKNFPFPYLVDETQRLTYFYGAEKTPHAFVLRKSGAKYIVSYIGAIDDDFKNEKEKKDKYVEAAVDELLAGKPVTRTMTKAIGCIIKWKQ